MHRARRTYHLETGRSLSPVPRGIIPILGIVVAGLLVHGPHATELGLYWDDAPQLLIGLQAAHGNVVRFVLSDTGGAFAGALRSERPFAYLAFLVGRLAFAVNLPALHWMLIGLLILNAVVVAGIARRVVDEDWFFFTAGMMFVSSPLTGQQAIWPATIHYLLASLLGLLAVLIAFSGLAAGGRHRLWHCALASVLYLASMLTQEALAPIPLAFILAYVLWGRQARTTDSGRRGMPTFSRPERDYLISLFSAAVVYGAWRVFLQPIYGHQEYSLAGLTLSHPKSIVVNALVGLRTVLLPWGDAARQLVAFPPAPTDLFLSLVPSAVVGGLTFHFLLQLDRSGASISSIVTEVQIRSWLRALTIAAVVIMAAVIFIGISPTGFTRINKLEPGPRTNFTATAGVAVGLPATFALLMLLRVPSLMMSVATRYRRVAIPAGVIVLFSLVFVGFVRFPKAGNIVSHRSGLPELFGRYTIGYFIALLGYVLALILVLVFIILAVQSWRGRTWHRTPGASNALLSLVPASSLSVVIASLVLLSTLFHFSVKRQFSAEWSRQLAMLEQLQRIAPGLKPNSFVVIVDARSDRPEYAPYRVHREVSSFLLALYGDWSIMGNLHSQLRFHPDGVDSTSHGRLSRWFSPGAKGLWDIDTPLAVRRISYDRLVLFGFDGDTIRMLPRIQVTTEEGMRLLVPSHSERILRRVPKRTAAWERLTLRAP